ncbi:MAG TPA: hypothetical protein VHG10_09105, partial [Glycomyces sp.]|nr:hypothetical protein [Glycomyces sp.]
MSDRNSAAERESEAEQQRGAEPKREGDRRSGALRSLDPVAAYERRTTRIREEIARNRRGEYTVPTWVLAVALAAVIAVWILILFVL